MNLDDQVEASRLRQQIARRLAKQPYFPAQHPGGWYAEQFFPAADVEALSAAIRLVNDLPSRVRGRWVRCHELARAVAHRIDRFRPRVADGKRGPQDHSWIVLPSGAVLDVYVPGQMPSVALVHPDPLLVPYVEGAVPRGDVEQDVVEMLLYITEPWF